MIRWFLISLSIALLPSLCFGWGAGDGRGFIGGTQESSTTCSPLVSQDFTTWDEVDTGGVITVTSSSISFKEMGKANRYVREDFTAAPFDDDFLVEWDAVKNSTDLQDWSIHLMFALAKTTTSIFGLSTTGDTVFVESRKTSTDNYIRMRIVEDGSGRNVVSSNISNDTTYYFSLSRDDDGGVNGTGRYILTIRTGSQSGAVFDTLTLDSSSGEQNDFIWVYAYDAFANLLGYVSAGTISNYEVCK